MITSQIPAWVVACWMCSQDNLIEMLVDGDELAADDLVQVRVYELAIAEVMGDRPYVRPTSVVSLLPDIATQRQTTARLRQEWEEARHDPLNNESARRAWEAALVAIPIALLKMH